jgi:methylated-DNA-protein-cysteine methyltransferase-like protein
VREHAAVTPLERDVVEVLRALQPGEVVTYGEVAEEAGHPGRARAVGRILAAGVDGAAWWRVVAASGRLVPGLEVEQAALLRAEGVEVGERGVRVMRGSRRRSPDHRARPVPPVPRRSSR